MSAKINISYLGQVNLQFVYSIKLLILVDIEFEFHQNFVLLLEKSVL